MKRLLGPLTALAFLWPMHAFAEDAGRSTSELSYESFVESDKRIKCLYGYAAEKTGDHASAIRIFEDCIRRWNDVYSMIWLSAMYETGSGMPQDLRRATELIRRGAEADNDAEYSPLARFHYGVALYEGKGVDKDTEAGLRWLRRAASENQGEAAEYLRKIGAGS